MYAVKRRGDKLYPRCRTTSAPVPRTGQNVDLAKDESAPEAAEADYARQKKTESLFSCLLFTANHYF